MSTTPVVKVYRNPWRAIVSDRQLLDIFTATATEGDAQLTAWLGSKFIEDPADNSFGWAMLDPTAPRGIHSVSELLLATIGLGPDGHKFTANGLAKADAADRHGWNDNGEIVTANSHLLGDGDFAWGSNAYYRQAYAGGSGLSSVQDKMLAAIMLEPVVDEIIRRRDTWISERRANGGSQGWYNPENLPGEQYATALAQHPIAG